MPAIKRKISSEGFRECKWNSITLDSVKYLYKSLWLYATWITNELSLWIRLISISNKANEGACLYLDIQLVVRQTFDQIIRNLSLLAITVYPCWQLHSCWLTVDVIQIQSAFFKHDSSSVNWLFFYCLLSSVRNTQLNTRREENQFSRSFPLFTFPFHCLKCESRYQFSIAFHHK